MATVGIKAAWSFANGNRILLPEIASTQSAGKAERFYADRGIDRRGHHGRLGGDDPSTIR